MGYEFLKLPVHCEYREYQKVPVKMNWFKKILWNLFFKDKEIMPVNGKWETLNLEVINIIQQEKGIFPSIKVFKLNGAEISCEKITVNIEMGDIITAFLEVERGETQKCIVSNIKIGSKNNGNN